VVNHPAVIEAWIGELLMDLPAYVAKSGFLMETMKDACGAVIVDRTAKNGESE
jgi:hypothetical protein